MILKKNKLHIITSQQFIKSFEPLLEESKKALDLEHKNLTLRRDCRHEVRVFVNDVISMKEYRRLKRRNYRIYFY